MEIIEFRGAPEEECVEIEEMTRQELQAFLEELEQMLTQLDAREPKNQRSDDYEAWAQEHEDLEDAIDEVREYLDRSEAE